MSVVVSDTSPIRALDHLRMLSLLRELYGEILIPPGVAAELLNPDSALPPLDWKTIPGVTLQAPTDAARVSALREELDLGESEAIALALEVHASALLVDERAARAIAASLGLKSVGVLAMLVEAKRRGLTPSLGPLMHQLQTGIGFHISPILFSEVLRLAGE